MRQVTGKEERQREGLLGYRSEGERGRMLDIREIEKENGER